MVASLSFTMWATIAAFAYLAYSKRKVIHDYYKALSIKRGESKTDFVESYKTLREHGNAFYIIVWEVMLMFIIFALLEVRKITDVDDAFFVMLSAMVLWVLPAVFAWYVAGQIECDFIEDA